MEKINIIVTLDNKDLPYEYTGMAFVNKDIIEYDDIGYNFKKFHYIFDKTVKRLIKSSSDDTIILDFLNEEVIVRRNNNDLMMKIKVKKLEIDGNNIDVIYIIDKEDIKFQIKEVNL